MFHTDGFCHVLISFAQSACFHEMIMLNSLGLCCILEADILIT